VPPHLKPWSIKSEFQAAVCLEKPLTMAWEGKTNTLLPWKNHTGIRLLKNLFLEVGISL
jgi:hypothetical protein